MFILILLFSISITLKLCTHASNKMKFVFYFLIYEFFVHTESSNHRSVNLALETVLEFDEKNRSDDIKIINKVKHFLDKVKGIIQKDGTGRRNFDEDLRFTDFLRHTLSILNSYEDNDLLDVVTALNDEIRKFNYKNCKFYELVDNENLRRDMGRKLKHFIDLPAEDLREKLNNAFVVFETGSFSDKERRMLDFVDSLYSRNSTQNFISLLDGLKRYSSKSKRSNTDLIEIVRDAVRNILFDHYTNLNKNARRELKMKLEAFWQDFSKPRTVVHHVFNLRPFTKSNLNENIARVKNTTLRKQRANVTSNKHNDIGIATQHSVNVTTAKFNKTITKRNITKSTTKKRHKKHKIKTKKPKKVKRNRNKKKETTQSVEQVTPFLKHRYMTFSEKELLTEKKRHSKHKSTSNLRFQTKKRRSKLKKSTNFRQVTPIMDDQSSLDKQSADKEENPTLESEDVETTSTTRRRRERYHHRSSTIRKPTMPVLRTHVKKRKYLIIPSVSKSDEGLSIESFEYKKSLRRNMKNDTLKSNIENLTANANVIKRIEDLEKELVYVKKQISNSKTNDSRKAIAKDDNLSEKLESREILTRKPESSSNTTKNAKAIKSISKTALVRSTTAYSVPNYTKTSAMVDLKPHFTTHGDLRDSIETETKKSAQITLTTEKYSMSPTTANKKMVTELKESTTMPNVTTDSPEIASTSSNVDEELKRLNALLNFTVEPLSLEADNFFDEINETKHLNSKEKAILLRDTIDQQKNDLVGSMPDVNLGSTAEPINLDDAFKHLNEVEAQDIIQ